MKTIEQFVFDKYLSQQSKAEKYKIDASNYIDWAHIAVKEAQRWIPIKEELPKLHEDILIYDEESEIWDKGCLIHISGDSMWSSSSGDIGNVTHWRPLFRK